MLLYRCILPKWAQKENPKARRVWEGEFSAARIQQLNQDYYNIYFLPNRPSHYEPGKPVDGASIDQFQYVFVDMDLKSGDWPDKDTFLEAVSNFPATPTRIVDSGNGIHVYWEVSDLDAMSYLRFQRRLCRALVTDEAVGQVYQLMRVAGTVNTKDPEHFKLCEELFQAQSAPYTSEQLDGLLPPITHDDEQYCQDHYRKTYDPESQKLEIEDTLPLKFCELLRSNAEVKSIWSGDVEDRSKADYRLGHIMLAHGFKKSEAMSVLVNSSKAVARAPKHRVGYAQNIVEKIWTFEEAEDKGELTLSSSVRDILRADPDSLKGARLRGWEFMDATEHGFRLGQVHGLVAGSGVGKTAFALNMFMAFVRNNPDYVHFFVPLEQPAHEIADRWRTMCGAETHLHDKVHVMSNYDDVGGYRRLSLSEIKTYLVAFQKKTGQKIGCVVIDHIGALKPPHNSRGGREAIEDICHEMKSFAIETNTLVVMQSQAPREKAGIGDLELNKDAAYGTVYFESYCDFVFTIWQPLKRCYDDATGGSACPTVTAFKPCKIRHKKQGVDRMKEDVRYRVYFDPLTETMRELTQIEEKAFDFFNKRATNLRKLDRKTDTLTYRGMEWTKDKNPA